MTEREMEDLIAAHVAEFFPRRILTLKGRQGFFPGVGREIWCHTGAGQQAPIKVTNTTDGRNASKCRVEEREALGGETG